MHTYIHIYIHTYKHIYIHTYKHIYIHTYISLTLILILAQYRLHVAVNTLMNLLVSMKPHGYSSGLEGGVSFTSCQSAVCSVVLLLKAEPLLTRDIFHIRLLYVTDDMDKHCKKYSLYRQKPQYDPLTGECI